MYSFYGGQKGQDFKITRIFSNRAIDMTGDLKARWTSPVNVGDYVFINYGDPSYMDEETSNYNINLQIDLKDSGKSYTNSLWQKIYVDRNLTISPDFPENDNNIYVFLNLDESTEDYGESLKEISDLETEECFGFGYRLIACVTGVTPRIQVFHQTINIEDGDPYVTLDLTNPDTPKIKFYLQRGQKIEELYKNIVGSQEEPNVYWYTDGRTYLDKDGNIKIATLTNPQIIFDLPKAPTFFYGMLFGTGPLNFFHNIGNLSNKTAYATNDIYKVYNKEIKLISFISDFLYHILISDTVKYALDESSKNNDGIYTKLTINKKQHFYYNCPKNFLSSTDETLNRSSIFIQDDENVIFNPFYNLDEKDIKANKEKIKQFYQKLKDDYNLSAAPYIIINDKGEEVVTKQYMWTNTDVISSVKTDLLSSLIENTFPSSLFPLSTIINNLIEYLFTIIDEDNEGNISLNNNYPDNYFSFENYNTADYLLGVLNQSSLLTEHYYDISSNGYKADFYINEPTGKIYILSFISNTYIEGKYIGTITAPTPIATTKIIPSFYYDTKLQKYVKNKNQVVSSLSEDKDKRVYQEEFLFKLVNDPITLVKIKQVANDQKIVIEEPNPQNENEQIVNIEVPMPIHIFTPQDSGLSISNNKVIWDSSGYNGPLFSKGDLFFNITDLENNNANRGEVYRYNQLPKDTLNDQIKIPVGTMSDSWDFIGSIRGIPGIPNPTKIVNITLIPDNNSFRIVYNGVTNNTTFNYTINQTPNNSNESSSTPTLITIIQNILTGTNIIKSNSSLTLPNLTVNTNNGEILLINYFSFNGASPESYWGIYTNNSWNIMSFSGGGSSFLNNKPDNLTEQHKQQGYSVDYLETKFLNSHLIWYDWD